MKLPTPGAFGPARIPPYVPAPPVTDSRIEAVLLVHGTFANVARSGLPDWWRRDSAFCRDLDAELATAGSQARCWSQLALPRPVPRLGEVPRATIVSEFAWTGANSEQDRRAAGRALASQMARLEHDERVRRYHLVGHSHGGNVMLNALRALPAAPTKLGAVVFLGTPVLRFSHVGLVTLQNWLASPLYVLLTTGCVWAATQAPEGQERNWILVTATASLACLVIELAGLVSAKEAAERRGIYGSGRPHAFVFERDEAADALHLAQDVVRAPWRFVRQFFRASTPPPPAVAAAEAPSDLVQRSIARSRPFTLLRSAQQQLGLDPAKQTASAFGTGTMLNPAGPLIWAIGAIAAAVALLPAFVVAVLAMVFRAAGALVGLLTGRLALWTAQVLLWVTLRLMVKRKAFGAGAGYSFAGLDRRPPEVDSLEIVDDSLGAEVRTVADDLLLTSGGLLRGAVFDADALAIKSRVEIALTDPRLVHSHYYRSAAVCRRVAAAIAAAGPPAVPPEQPAPRTVACPSFALRKLP